MPRYIAWVLLAQHSTADSFIKHRATDFCCSAAYVKRSVDCKFVLVITQWWSDVCTAQALLVERPKKIMEE
jgi:hypothetical protein